jgi:hypothetical protein
VLVGSLVSSFVGRAVDGLVGEGLGFRLTLFTSTPVFFGGRGIECDPQADVGGNAIDGGKHGRVSFHHQSIAANIGDEMGRASHGLVN